MVVVVVENCNILFVGLHWNKEKEGGGGRTKESINKFKIEYIMLFTNCDMNDE